MNTSVDNPNQKKSEKNGLVMMMPPFAPAGASEAVAAARRR
jgi:hypothetical protein